jgi:hypothetical protein
MGKFKKNIYIYFRQKNSDVAEAEVTLRLKVSVEPTVGLATRY